MYYEKYFTPYRNTNNVGLILYLNIKIREALGGAKQRKYTCFTKYKKWHAVNYSKLEYFSW